MALSRDLASNNLWVESLERSLARRGRPRRASLELGKLNPPRDLSDPDNFAESVVYWRTRRSAGSGSPIPAAGGATALALLAATTLPALTSGGHAANSSKTAARRSSGTVAGAATRTQLVDHASVRHQDVNASAASALGAAPALASAAAATASDGKVIYGSVDSVQQMLGVSVDGQIGPKTGAAIREFQASHGLTVNGIVDQTTYDAMQAAIPTSVQPSVAAPAASVDSNGLAHVATASATASVAATVPVDPTTSTPTATGGTSVPTTGTVAATTGDTPEATAPVTTTDATTTTTADTTVATQPAVPGGVDAVQTALHVEVDGTFGSQTKAAVEAFQSSHGLAVDGVVGPDTRAALGLGAGPTLHDTQPPPPPPAPVTSDASGTDTPAAGTGGATTTTTDTTTPSSDTSSPATTDTSTPTTTTTNTGEPANVATGMAEMVAAADQIATLPYIWGGGHGAWVSPGYDCSGSVSYVLHAAGLLSEPEDSDELMSYGAPGPGKYITIYATDGHAWMTIDGRRFDTVALSEDGSRWGDGGGEFDGYVERHPIGY